MLPYDIYYNICLHTSYNDIKTLSSVSKTFNTIVNTDGYWVGKGTTQFKMSSNKFNATSLNPKQRYLQLLSIRYAFEGAEKYHNIYECIILAIKQHDLTLIQYFTNLLHPPSGINKNKIYWFKRIKYIPVHKIQRIANALCQIDNDEINEFFIQYLREHYSFYLIIQQLLIHAIKNKSYDKIKKLIYLLPLYRESCVLKMVGQRNDLWFVEMYDQHITDYHHIVDGCITSHNLESVKWLLQRFSQHIGRCRMDSLMYSAIKVHDYNIFEYISSKYLDHNDITSFYICIRQALSYGDHKIANLLLSKINKQSIIDMAIRGNSQQVLNYIHTL